MKRCTDLVNGTTGELIGHMVECPACRDADRCWAHVFHIAKDGRGWNFDGNYERPTFSPSMLAYDDKGYRCHSFVRDGKIEYLGDCTHSMAGQTIELPVVDR